MDESSNDMHVPSSGVKGQYLLAIIAICVVVFSIARPLFSNPGLPNSTDVHGHLARAWYMTEAFKETGSIPSWFPYWYNGTPLLQYYPPLAAFVMFALQLIIGNLEVTYRVFVLLCLILAGVVTYYATRRWLSSVYSLVAAIFYIANPYTIYTVFGEGNMPRTFFLILQPLALFLALRILDEGDRRSFLSFTLVIAVMTITHQLQAAMTVGLLFIIGIGYARQLDRIMTLLLGLVLGLALASMYILPAMTHADFPTVPNLTIFPERLITESANWQMISPMIRRQGLGYTYIGLSVFLLSLLGLVFAKRKHWYLLGISALIGMLLALGVNNPIYTSIPFHGSLLPKRFLSFVILLLALLAGRGLQGIHHQLGKIRDLKFVNSERVAVNRIINLLPKTALLIGILLVMVDYAPTWRLVRTSSYAEERALMQNLVSTSSQGRVAPYIAGESQWSLMPLLYGYGTVDGYSPETTPHLQTIIAMRIADRSGFGTFIGRELHNWNAGSVLLDNNFSSLERPLEEVGYVKVEAGQAETVTLYQAPTSLTKVLSRSSLVIGRGAYTATSIFPWLSYGTSWSPEEYSPDYLDSFDLIYLFDFRYKDLFNLENLLRQLVANGKTIIIDFTGMENPNLFGVRGRLIEITEEPVFQAVDGSGLEGEKFFQEPFLFEGNPWRGMVFEGLNGTVLEVVDKNLNANWSVMGYRDLLEGRVYFVGMSWLTHIFQTHDEASMSVMESLFNIANPVRELALPEFTTQFLEPPSDSWSFGYKAAKDTMILISVTWSPHWNIYIDDKPIEIYNHENLIALKVPSGEHVVHFEYKMTPIQWVGWGGTLVAALFFGLSLKYFSHLTGWLKKIPTW